MSMSSARSTTAPCPANKLLLPPGATIARVTPDARLTATGEPIGLSAGAMSSPAEKRERGADRSLVPVTARPEERRVGKDCFRTWRSRWAPNHYINKSKPDRTHIIHQDRRT